MPHLTHQRLRKLADIRRHAELWCSQTSDDFSLAGSDDLSVTQERRQHLLVPQVLAPGFERLRRLADSLAEPHERVSEAVRVEVWQARGGEGVAEDRANARCATPVLSVQASSCCCAPKADRLCVGAVDQERDQAMLGIFGNCAI